MIIIYDLTGTPHTQNSERISFNQCGMEYRIPGHAYGPRAKYYCLIHFILEGKGKVIINTKQYEVQAGEAFLIPANATAYYKADKEHPWKYCWISFAGTQAQRYTDQIFGKGNFIKKFSEMRQIWRHMRGMLEKFFPHNDLEEMLCSHDFCFCDANTYSESFFLNSGLYMLLSMLFKEQDQRELQKQQGGYAGKIKNYIDSYFMEVGEISQVAKRFHLHPNYLAAVFKKEYFISPKQYLLTRKIDYASYLLKETDNSIQSIALTCGFANTSAFGKVYKRYVGVPPGVYRKNSRGLQQENRRRAKNADTGGTQDSETVQSAGVRNGKVPAISVF